MKKTLTNRPKKQQPKSGSKKVERTDFESIADRLEQAIKSRDMQHIQRILRQQDTLIQTKLNKR